MTNKKDNYGDSKTAGRQDTEKSKLPFAILIYIFFIQILNDNLSSRATQTNNGNLWIKIIQYSSIRLFLA